MSNAESNCQNNFLNFKLCLHIEKLYIKLEYKNTCIKLQVVFIWKAEAVQVAAGG